MLAINRCLHDSLNWCLAWFLIPSRTSSCCWSLTKTTCSWSWSFHTHSEWSWLWPSSWCWSFTKCFCLTKSWRCSPLASICRWLSYLLTRCQIPSISSWCSSLHGSSSWSIPFSRDSISNYGLLNWTSFLFIPIRWLWKAFNWNIRSASCIFHFLSFISLLFLCFFLFFFSLLNSSINISSFIF